MCMQLLTKVTQVLNPSLVADSVLLQCIKTPILYESMFFYKPTHELSTPLWFIQIFHTVSEFCCAGEFSCLSICHRDKQMTHLIQSVIVQAACHGPSLHTKPLWPAPTPRQATGGMLRLVFSQSSAGRGLQRAEI